MFETVMITFKLR